MTKWVLYFASGVTLWSSSGPTTRPFICSKYPTDFTVRRNSRHSSGFTSLPVAIMSTDTAIRGLKLLRNSASNSSGFFPVVL